MPLLDKKITIFLDEKPISVFLADNFLSRAFGLMFENPAGFPAMLFTLNSETRPAVWNLGMRFPIDILWLKSGKVIGKSSLPIFCLIPRVAIPPSVCDSFLEIRAGILNGKNINRVKIIPE